MKVSRTDMTKYGSTGIAEININNSYEIDFLGVFIAILLGIIAWEILNKRIYVPPSVWSVVIIFLILGIILLALLLAVVLIGLIVSLKFLIGD